MASWKRARSSYPYRSNISQLFGSAWHRVYFLFPLYTTTQDYDLDFFFFIHHDYMGYGQRASLYPASLFASRYLCLYNTWPENRHSAGSHLGHTPYGWIYPAHFECKFPLSSSLCLLSYHRSSFFASCRRILVETRSASVQRMDWRGELRGWTKDGERWG